MSQASRTSTVSPTRNGLNTSVSTKQDKAEGKGGRISAIAAEEIEVIELVDTPTAADGDVEMNGDDTVDEDADDGEDGEGDEEGEADGAEEGSGSEEDDDEEEEEDDEEDEEEDSGDESEDLGGSPEIVAIDGPNGPPRLSLPPTVKTEPGEEGVAPAGIDETALAAAGAVTAEGEVNVLAPKKKKRVRPRSPSEDVDLPPPPPPMRTIRLESQMMPEGETLEWDILEDARAHGMVAEVWAVAEDDVPAKEGEGGAAGLQADGQADEGEVNGLSNGPGPAGPSSGPLFGLGFGDEDPEEIARRLEERYGDDNRKSKKAKSKKKKPIDYDLNDPFIDDSEIMIDAPTHYARPKKEGFFVHAGMLELMEESPVKAKPRTTKAKARTSNAVPAPPKPPRRSLSAAVLSHQRREAGFKGSEAEPISIDDSDGETKAAGPSKPKPTERRSGSLSPPPGDDDEEEKDDELNLKPVEIDRVLYKSSSKDPALLPPYLSFPTAVRRRLNALRAESEKHDWGSGTRGKFPDHLRGFLNAAGRAAYEHDLFGLNDREGADKSFFLALPSALPYNEFTLRKLVTKLCYVGYWNWLQACEEEGIEQFKAMVNQEKDDILSKYEEAHKAWEIEVKEWDEKHPNAAGNPTAPSTSAQAEPMAIDTLINGPSASAVPSTGLGTPKLDDTRPVEPPKRFTWTADMREVFGQLLENMSDIVDLAKRAVEWNIQSAKTGKEWGETATKIRLYKKINDSFPDGFMNTSIISREMTKLRGNKKKQQVDQDGDVA
ncbi:hypothetical protein IAU59_003011 [Kwoniella sp. CBS 9459]